MSECGAVRLHRDPDGLGFLFRCNRVSGHDGEHWQHQPTAGWSDMLEPLDTGSPQTDPPPETAPKPFNTTTDNN